MFAITKKTEILPKLKTEFEKHPCYSMFSIYAYERTLSNGQVEFYFGKAEVKNGGSYYYEFSINSITLAMRCQGKLTFWENSIKKVFEGYTDFKWGSFMSCTVTGKYTEFYSDNTSAYLSASYPNRIFSYGTIVMPSTYIRTAVTLDEWDSLVPVEIFETAKWGVDYAQNDVLDVYSSGLTLY